MKCKNTKVGKQKVSKLFKNPQNLAFNYNVVKKFVKNEDKEIKTTFKKHNHKYYISMKNYLKKVISFEN